MKNPFATQLGISLLELMLVLAIISIMLISATRYYLVTDSARKVNAGIELVRLVMNASEDVKLSSATNDYSEFTTGEEKGFKLLEDRGLVAEANAQTPWGSKIVVMSEANGSNYSIKLLGLPQKDCLQLAEKLINLACNAAEKRAMDFCLAQAGVGSNYDFRIEVCH